MFKCRKCGRGFTSRDTLSNHHRGFHKNLDEPARDVFAKDSISNESDSIHEDNGLRGFHKNSDAATCDSLSITNESDCTYKDNDYQDDVGSPQSQGSVDDDESAEEDRTLMWLINMWREQCCPNTTIEDILHDDKLFSNLLENLPLLMIRLHKLNKSVNTGQLATAMKREADHLQNERKYGKCEALFSSWKNRSLLVKEMLRRLHER